MPIVDLKSDLSTFRKKEENKYLEELQKPKTIQLEDRKSNLGDISNQSIDVPKKESPINTKPFIVPGPKNPKIVTELSQTSDNIIDPNIDLNSTQTSGVIKNPDILTNPTNLTGNITDPDISPAPESVSEPIDPQIETVQSDLTKIEELDVPTEQTQLTDNTTDPQIETNPTNLTGNITDPDTDVPDSRLFFIENKSPLEEINEYDGVSILEDIQSDLDPETIEQTTLSGLVDEDTLTISPSATDLDLNLITTYENFFLENNFIENEKEIYNNNGIILSKYFDTVARPRGLQIEDKITIGDQSYGNTGTSIDFIRGGQAERIISAEERSRFINWLETPNGKSWILLQEGLQLMNPNMETRQGFAGTISSLQTKVFNVDSAINNVSQQHLGIRFPRHGLSPSAAFENSYENIVSDNNKADIQRGINFINTEELQGSRMVQLYDELITPSMNSLDNKSSTFFTRIKSLFGTIRNIINIASPVLTLVGLFTNRLDLTSKLNNALTGITSIIDILLPDNQVIKTLSGPGGPNSVLGVGETRVFRYANSFEGISYNASRIQSAFPTAPIAFRSSNNPYIKNDSPGQKPTINIDTGVSDNTDNSILYSLGGGALDKIEANRYKDIDSYINAAFNQSRREPLPIRTPNPDTPVDLLKNINKANFSLMTFEQLRNPVNNTTDLIKFFLTGPKDSREQEEEAFVFEANIDTLNDTFSPSIDLISYIGRADPGFIYKSFIRTFDLSFKIISHNKDQLRSNYRKLNYLASYTTPEYDDELRMINPFMRITIGDYFNNTPIILTGMFINITSENVWEIESSDDVKQLPLFIDVTINGYVVTDFKPQKGGNFFGYDDWLNGPEPFIPNNDPVNVDLSSLGNTLNNLTGFL